MTFAPNPAGRGGYERGQSGNPGGRPKAAAVMTAEARRYCIKAIHALVLTMRTETGAPRIAAANALLDRGFGRPAQNVDLTLSKKISEMTLEELSAVEAQMVGVMAPAALEHWTQPDLVDGSAPGERIELDDPEPRENGQ
jgi:hypothetical protein